MPTPSRQAKAVNQFSTTLAVPHLAGSGTLVLAAGAGSRLGALEANRVYRVVAVTNPRTASEAVVAILEATGLAGDTLSGVTGAEGMPDVDLAAGTTIEVRVTAAYLGDLQTGLNALESVAVSTATTYSNPAWISQLAGSKITGDIPGNSASITGSVTQSQVAGLVSDLGNLTTQVGLRALDSATVHNTGAETIAGTKTFSSTPVLGTLTGFVRAAAGALSAAAIAIADIASALASGVAGGATWCLGSNAGDNGRIDSTSNATKGTLNLNGTALGIGANGSMTQTVTDSVASSPQKTGYSTTCNFSTSTGVNNNGNGGLSSVVTFTITSSTVATRTAVGVNSSLTLSSGSNAGWTSGNWMGYRAVVTNASNQTLGFAHGLESSVGSTGASATTTNARGVYTSVIKTGSVTNGVGVYCDSPSGAGACTNLYGLYVADQTAGSTLNYAIYTNGGQVRLGDNVMVGGTGTFGGGAGGCVLMTNVTAAPSSNPTGGGVLYCESGVLKFRTGASVTTLATSSKPTVTGSRADGSALASLLTALASLGLITDSTTA